MSISGTADAADRRGSLTPALTDPRTRTLILLPVGFVAGPSGMALLSSPALTFLGPVVAVALTLIGALLGMSAAARSPGVGRSLRVASLEASATALLVVGGLAAVERAGGTTGPGGLMLAILGACAAAFLVPAPAPAYGAVRPPTVGDLSSILAIGAGAIVLVLVRHPGVASAAAALAGLSAVAVAVACAGWMLVGSAASDRERHTFVAGALLLLGGSATYLGSSALFVGVLAGFVWGRLAGAAGDRIARDMQYVQHPLVVLLLLVAGARLAVTAEGLALALAYVVCRTAGRLIGASLRARDAADGDLDADRRSTVAPAGAMGIALAVDVLHSHATGAEATLVLATVVVASLLIDGVHLAAARAGDARS